MGNVLTCAYVRGITERLLSGGNVKVASLDHAARIADSVGSRVNYPIWEKAATADLVAEIANEVLKVAAEGDRLVDAAPGQDNTLANAAAQAGSLADLEQKERPAGTYLEGPGSTKVDTSPGEVGKVTQAPGSPAQDVANSANEDAKTAAALRKLLNKLSSDALVTGDRPEQKNTLENAAAQAGGMAAMEAEQRPTGQNLVGVGKTNLTVPPVGVVGAESVLGGGTAAAVGAPAIPAPVNSVVSESEKAGSFEDHFRKTAHQILPLLPRGLSDSEKIAAVRTCMGLSSVERLQYLTKISEEGALPDDVDSGMESEPEKKCDKCGKDMEECVCDEEEKEDEMSEEEKSAAFSLLRRLAALK